MEKRINTSVFISGRGSNLKSLYKFSKSKKTPIKINLIVTDNKDALGLKFVKKKKIKLLIVNYKNILSAEKLILKLMSKESIQLICLAGFMKILTKKFIKSFKGKIINIHPSLLPKYKGLNTHKRALKNKDKFVGCTVHYVSSKIDSGRIILRKKVKISKMDTENSLKLKVLRAEHKLYPAAINKIKSSF